MSIGAAQAVGEQLQSPEDLLKIAAFRKKLVKEKASIDTKLKSGVKDQLDATREGLKKLFSARNNVQVIREEMTNVDRMCRDPQHSVKTFDQISRVSMVHRNFALVDEMVTNLMDMYAKLDDLEVMLASDREDIRGRAPNILVVHHHLHQLEAFRNQTLHQAKSASPDARVTLTRWFSRLDKVIKDFDEYIIEIARNILPIARAGNTEAIVKLIKIAEIEGKEDEKAIAIKLVRKAANMDAAAKFKSMQANARQIKHYRSNIVRTITESIKAALADAYAQDKDDPKLFLDNLGWVYQDLIRIEEDVAPCFPPSYDIYSHYVREYHRAINVTVKRLVADEPGASVILALHAWIKEYKKSMKELQVSPQLLEPGLLDGKEQTLIEDYLQIIIKKLDEWTANLMKTEVDEFITRKQAPDQDADGMYGMQGAVIMFQMINQQADLAADSGQGAILARVVEDSNRVMRETQAQWTKVLETEYKKQVEKPEEVTEGLVEYVSALANDQIKSADFAEALSARLEPLVSEKYRVVISEKLNEAIDGYLDVAKKCTQTLIDLIFNDLKPATKQLFGPGWYDGIMSQSIATIRDYMSDYQTFLNPSLVDLLVEDLLDTFVITYLNALANASKLRMPAAPNRIKEDVSEAFTFFAAYKPAKELERYFEVIEQVLSLLEASRSLVFLSYWSFAKVHGPCLTFVESLMKARDDLDRSAVNEVMDSIRRKIKDEGLVDPPEATIMKKVVVQGTFARLLNKQ